MAGWGSPTAASGYRRWVPHGIFLLSGLPVWESLTAVAAWLAGHELVASGAWLIRRRRARRRGGEAAPARWDGVERRRDSPPRWSGVERRHPGPALAHPTWLATGAPLGGRWEPSERHTA